MPRIELRTEIDSDIETCFDLARNIDFHTKSLGHTNERAVAGVTSGLIELGQSVTWRANHFGFALELTSKISRYDRPHLFRDTMTCGQFKRFDHDHIFNSVDNKTVMIDIFDYESPFYFFGKIADLIFLETYMRQLLQKRNIQLKAAAEAEANK